MIANLSSHLGIPAESLLKKPQSIKKTIKVNSAALKQMKTRGYFDSIKNSKDSILEAFFSSFPAPAYLRQSEYRSTPTTDYYALVAWSKKVIHEASKISTTNIYSDGFIDLAFMQKIARLSTKKDFIYEVKSNLLKAGVILVFEPHLEKTRLDGAAILVDPERPIIGITLRMGRLDNFWFTLMHELAHLSLRKLNKKIDFYYDELDGYKGEELSVIEQRADALASEALVPNDKWQISPARLLPNPMAISSLAQEINVHPVIIAGKFRHETGKCSNLSRFIGKYPLTISMVHGENGNER
jgi:HTH-type transcriptional regulator/antitoxin HigA